LPGSGELADQWVILGAHYDHVGLGFRSEVYNGADDNASGTALVLEIARVLGEYVESNPADERDRRSVMFQTYGAEEVGLIGSNYFCSNPAVPLSSITAMVNLDMVGRLRGDTLVLIGTSSAAGWAPLVTGAGGAQFNLIVTDDAVNRSDQYCYFANGKPVMFVHTGTHPEYHTPADDVVTLNIDGMVRVGAFTLAALLDLMFRAEPLAAGGEAAAALAAE
jgi:Zn-dependent M28 family amino/carboxypeptidase